MKRFFAAVVFSIVLFIFPQRVFADTLWNIRSIDTMKYSRDPAREEMYNPAYDQTIEQHIKQIAASGANYVAIDTPYDEEFVPYLTRWVDLARDYHLHVWFRGNLSGWEGWFNYPEITRTQHIDGIKSFILKHPNLFADGDIFTSCPECENGGPGYPVKPADVASFRQFLITEYQTTQQAFTGIHKNVRANFISMNGALAFAVMDKPTTQALGGVVTIDHYVPSADKLSHDVDALAKQTGGKIILGEFGAPIPNITKNMNQDQQAEWLGDVFKNLIGKTNVIGMNYWTDMGGSTALWNNDGSARKAVGVITKFYTNQLLPITTEDLFGNRIGGVKLSVSGKTYMTNDAGEGSLPYSPPGTVINVSSRNFQDGIVKVTNGIQPITVRLEPKPESWWMRIVNTVKNFFRI